jgi:hypothetical protein
MQWIRRNKTRRRFVFGDEPDGTNKRLPSIGCIDYTLNYVSPTKWGLFNAFDRRVLRVLNQCLCHYCPMRSLKPKADEKRGFTAAIYVVGRKKVIGDFGAWYEGAVGVG